MAGEVRRAGAREIRDVVRGRTLPHVHLRSRLVFVTEVTIAIDVIASVLIFLFERYRAFCLTLCDSLIEGPICVSSRSPSPTVSDSARATNCSTNVL